MTVFDACADGFRAMGRRKTLGPDLLATQLRRCLNLSDLILMGIGNMVGTGIFVLTGQVARQTAGASVIVSYLISGFVASLSALCYAELAGVLPLSGSSYSYAYVVIGELLAFLVGWNSLLETTIGVASAAKAWSGNLDSLCNGSISRGIEAAFGAYHVRLLSAYPDFVAVGIVLLLAVLVAVGARWSSNFNNVMVAIKLIIIGIIIVTGLTLVDLRNWTDPGRGGFFPYGAGGTLAGASTCFYAFVGFDCLATASEETAEPRRMLPISIIASLAIVTCLYVVTSMVLTLMVPYSDIDPVSPYPAAFLERSVPWAVYVVGVGTMFGLSTVILTGLFSVPRIIYAMASDGLLFRWLGYVNSKSQTPVFAILITSLCSALLAFVLDLDVLVELLSIGTLFCYTAVAASVVIIRYTEPRTEAGYILDGDRGMKKGRLSEDIPLKTDASRANSYASTSTSADAGGRTGFQKYKDFLSTFDRYALVSRCLLVELISIAALLSLAIYGSRYIAGAHWWALLVLVIASVGVVLPLVLIASLDQRKTKDAFRVPLTPLVPGLSIMCNIGLMLMLHWTTWVRLSVWIVLGLILYFSYGIRHSNERQQSVSTYSEMKSTNAQAD